MPKIFSHTDDFDPRGLKPLDDRDWWSQRQALYVPFVNTDYGRDIFCLDSWTKMPYPVVGINRNMVQYLLGYQDGRRYLLSDIRIGCKWTNVFNVRTQEILKAVNRFGLLELQRWPRPVATSRSPLIVPSTLLETVYYTTDTSYPDAGTGNTTVDGRAFEETDAVWATIRGDVGDTASDTETQIVIQIHTYSTPSPQWGSISRGIFTFDTSGIGAGQKKDSATFEFVLQTTTNVDDFTDSLSMCASAPASNNAVVAGDYDSMGDPGIKQATDLLISGLTHDDATYSVFTLNSTGIDSIIVDGITPFGVRCTRDNDDDEPSPWAGSHQTRQDIQSADNTGTTVDPKLIVEHSTTVAPANHVAQLLRVGAI